ncbi:S8 family serine peptidase [Actinoplanes sp. RD1]|uniref:S8 family serine peptidase n=1 Tax=Actinoplanes sp. RD1 TaxID=3064538 RepID=UPI0027419BC0|nr:S8 family serine peptidase [Actinoplanes sp. RD1]
MRPTIPLAVLLLAVSAAAVALPGSSTAAAAPADPEKTSRYLVQLADDPLATYEGDVKGLPATKPRDGAKLNRGSAAARAYRGYLTGRRAAVTAKAHVTPEATMDTAFNGFVAELTPAQARTLRDTSGVQAVFADRTVRIQTSNTASYLGLSGEDGLWAQQYGGDTRAGEGVIVGVLDTGYWPESPSFAALPEPRPDQAVIDAKWKGTCDFGEEAQPLCNNKVIGARWYGGKAQIGNPEEFDSPRDANGHGTHTASTAAGRSGVAASAGGFDLGEITGMAPAARLAIYKVLWSDGAGGGMGAEADIVQAINDAVADGVDVINYSAGDGNEYWSATDAAFFNAAAAGVFVSAAAGNDGPGGTVDNTGPWVTTVAATEQDHRYLKTITLGDGRTVTGVGIGAGAGKAPLIDAADAAVQDDDIGRYYAGLCEVGALDPAKAKGKIVLCARGGETGRVAKGQVVAAAGGAAMILYQSPWDANGQIADLHVLPAAHVDDKVGAVLTAYAKTANPTATFTTGAWTPVEWPAVGGFSSRGPSVFTGADLLKPDIAAPGVDVAAATSPAEGDRDFTLMSGTSMAAPHLAGFAALVKGKHLDWTPDMVKSALMTTASAVTSTGGRMQKAGSDADANDYGAGEARPADALDPGLVYENDADDWLDFLCGVEDERGGDVQLTGLEFCADRTPLTARDLNYPSVSLGNMLGTQTVKRTVTNVSDKASQYKVSIDAPEGYRVQVSPASFALQPGKSVTYTIKVTHAGGASGSWVDGALTFSDNRGHAVRTPLIVRNTALVAPDTVTGTGTQGSVALQFQAGYTGTLQVQAAGLTAGEARTATLTGDTRGIDWNETDLSTLPAPLPASMLRTTVTVPSGAVNPQINLTSQYGTQCDDGDPCADWTALVYDAAGTFVTQAAATRRGATVVLPDGGGDYTLVIDQEILDGVASNDLTWTVVAPGAPGTTTGKLTIDPKRRTLMAGATATLTLRWSGLEAGRTYAGVLVVGDGTTELKRIPVTVTG